MLIVLFFPLRNTEWTTQQVATVTTYSNGSRLAFMRRLYGTRNFLNQSEKLAMRMEKGFSMVPSGRSGGFNSIRAAALSTAAGIATVLVLGLTAALTVSTPASAKPEFAAQTGMPCGQCHSNPAGGGKLKPFGEKFKENGFKVKK